jgi:hypothetical protein
MPPKCEACGGVGKPPDNFGCIDCDGTGRGDVRVKPVVDHMTCNSYLAVDDKPLVRIPSVLWRRLCDGDYRAQYDLIELVLNAHYPDAVYNCPYEKIWS